ncbi:Hypothetical predicted protein [Marmota monax]|uniref:Uncharacterized protein n=1 Tax=Marmota monax TaxID=9995 RepID=A0A5E4BNW6_MARMO|nr:Hypothetical predicted protein [Marmota monax]
MENGPSERRGRPGVSVLVSSHFLPPPAPVWGHVRVFAWDGGTWWLPVLTSRYLNVWIHRSWPKALGLGVSSLVRAASPQRPPLAVKGNRRRGQEPVSQTACLADMRVRVQPCAWSRGVCVCVCVCVRVCTRAWARVQVSEVPTCSHPSTLKSEQQKTGGASPFPHCLPSALPASSCPRHVLKSRRQN